MKLKKRPVFFFNFIFECLVYIESDFNILNFFVFQDGEVTDWRGVPILMDKQIPMDPDLAVVVDHYRQLIDSQVL
jgi:hypothetical protein